MITKILIAVAALGTMGLLFGILLAYASKVFAVKADERIDIISGLLPGANCGGCGYAGCSALAAAIVQGDAKVNACPVGGSETAAAIAKVMGVAEEGVVRKYSKVKCSGQCSVVQMKYDYMGIDDCESAARLADGNKACKYSCLGFGSCVQKCAFGAITLRDGVAFIDRDKCTACGVCVESCPRGLIELIPYDNQYWVSCSTHDKGAAVRKACEVGCIGCKLCEKACQYDAIHVIDNVAKIEYDKCTNCGACAEKCPRKIIKSVETEKVTVN